MADDTRLHALHPSVRRQLRQNKVWDTKLVRVIQNESDDEEFQTEHISDVIGTLDPSLTAQDFAIDSDEFTDNEGLVVADFEDEFSKDGFSQCSVYEKKINKRCINGFFNTLTDFLNKKGKFYLFDDNIKREMIYQNGKSLSYENIKCVLNKMKKHHDPLVRFSSSKGVLYWVEMLSKHKKHKKI